MKIGCEKANVMKLTIDDKNNIRSGMYLHR